ncbi:MAG: hypothetical protein CFE31_07765 [Rhizobiales bacterium PAR1]|nr:MAG: hypothetical protein CFE31_07765 [Rhizobiales bacterium PAR1]
MAKQSLSENRNTANEVVQLPADLADLHVRWPQLRCHIAAIAEKPGLCATERELINWMVKLGDRVGRRDID